MLRLLKILFFLAFLAGTFFLFDKNSEPINIYFFKGDPIVAPGYLVIIVFVMIGVLLGYIISLRNLISYRSEMSSLIKKNKEISDELDGLRNVAVGEEFNFNDKE
ncbi:MAG: LapA family protein [Candidatus Neomarinimicrobiota bacterium]|nr:LapA family protein [Candidatus Neomarinimicrobiota bacterium]